LTCLAVVDYRKHFIDIEAGWPGSVGDGRIWNCSVLKMRYQAWLSQFPSSSLATGLLATGEQVLEDIPPLILADSAYSNTKHMVTTFKTTECARDPVICALNKKLGGARYHVENAFGILKKRFQIFQRPLDCATEDIRLAIILTCSVLTLHNFLIDVKDAVTDTLNAEIVRERIGGELEQDAEENDAENVDEDVTTRNALIRHMTYMMELNDE